MVGLRVASASVGLSVLTIPARSLAVGQATTPGLGLIQVGKTLKPGLSGVVAEITDSTLFRLQDQSAAVRLAGLWPGDLPRTGNPLGQGVLNDGFKGKQVQLYLDRQEQDRFGHWLAHVVLLGEGEVGASGAIESEAVDSRLQGHLLSQGLARV
jgi:hypothetical protein